jgi:hypothetical protein
VGNFDFLSAQAPDPKKVVRAVASSSGWQLSEEADAWQLVVPIGALRKQTVEVRFDQKDKDGHDIISYLSTCGPASPENAMSLLKYNTQMVTGAFAVQDSASGEVVVICASQLSASVNPLDVSRLVSAIAWQADKVEEKLLGSDQN